MLYVVSFCEIQKFKNWGGAGWGWGGIGLGGQGGCERRSEAFVKIQKKNWGGGRAGGLSDQGLGWGRGA